MTAPPPAPAPYVDRSLIQKLSKAAAALDRADFLSDALTGERARRRRELEHEARMELRQLKDALTSMPLE
jgi:hypothetical protein